jgi:hypothetical protein
MHSLVLPVFIWTGKMLDCHTALWCAEGAAEADAHKDVMAQVGELGYRNYGSLREARNLLARAG